MSLLSLYANIVWRGNGPGALCKRKVAATLVGLNNSPQSLAEMHRIVRVPAKTDSDFDVAALQRILAEDPCFLMLDSTAVRLDLGHLIALAHSRLVKWVDAVFPPDAGPAAYLKNSLAKYIIGEQDALANASPRSLFTLPLSSAETMLDAYWSDPHLWSGTVSPAHDSAEALFLGDNLWFVQPGVSVKLNVAALVHRANSLKAATGANDEDNSEPNAHMTGGGGSGDFHEERSTGLIPMSIPVNVPVPSLAPPAWSVSGCDQDRRAQDPSFATVTTGPAVPPQLPPPTLLPSAALFAAAARDTVSRGLPTVPAPKPARSAAGLPGAEFSDLNDFTAVNDGPPEDMDLVPGGGFNSRLPWPGNDGSDLDASVANRFGSYIGTSGRQQMHHGQLSSSSVYDPLEAAVGEVAENVALEALGDSWIGLDRGTITSNPVGAAGSGVVGPRLGMAESAKGAAVGAAAAAAVADTTSGNDRGGGAPSGLQANRGWELFPSMTPLGNNVGRGGLTCGAGDDSTAAGGAGTGGEDGGGGGNMSLLEELCMTFAAPVGSVNDDAAASFVVQRGVCEPGAAESATPRPFGSGNDAAAGAAVSSWGGPWSSRSAATDGPERTRADPHLTGGGHSSEFVGGMSGGTDIFLMRAPPARLLGGYAFQSDLVDGQPSARTHHHQQTAATEATTGLQGAAAHSSGFDASMLGGGEGFDKLSARSLLHEQSLDRAQDSWRDPVILNARSGHTAFLSPRLGQTSGLVAAAEAGAAAAAGPAEGDDAARVMSRVIPFQLPPPPSQLSLTRGSAGVQGPGTAASLNPSVLPVAALHGFDVAAAAAAAAGRSLAGPATQRGGGGGLPPPFPIGMMAATAQGDETFRSRCSSGGTATAMGQLFQPPHSQQQAPPPQNQLLPEQQQHQQQQQQHYSPVSSPGLHHWENSQQTSVIGATAGAVQTGFPGDRASTGAVTDGFGADATDLAQAYSAAAARVWSDDNPQDKVRRLAASLLASSSSSSGSAARVPNSMGLDLLFRAVRRQDPVACNKAGNLMAVLEGDPYDCLSVVGDRSGNEIALLDLSRMMTLAGPAPTNGHAVVTAAVAATGPTVGTAPATAAGARFTSPSPVPQPQAPGHFAPKRQSLGDLAMAHQHPPWVQPAGGAGAGASVPAAPEGHHLEAFGGGTGAGGTGGGGMWLGSSQGLQLQPSGISTGTPPLAPMPSRGSWLGELSGGSGAASMGAAQQLHGESASQPPRWPVAPSQAPQESQQHVQAAAKQALKAAVQGQQQQMQLQAATHSGAPATAAGGAVAGLQGANTALLLQYLQMREQQQQQHLSPTAAIPPPGLLASGAQPSSNTTGDAAMLLQLLQAQQQAQVQAQQQLQAAQLFQQAQAQAQAAAAQQAAAQMQQVAQLQQLQMILRQRNSAMQQQQQQQQQQQMVQAQLALMQRQRAQAAQVHAQAQLTARVALLPNPAAPQATALSGLLQQYNASTAALPSGSVVTPPLTLAALSNVGGLPVSGGPVAQSQSHANVAAWLAAQAHINAGAPPSQVLSVAPGSHQGAATASAAGEVAGPEREEGLSSEQQQQQHQQQQQPKPHEEQQQQLVEYIVRKLQQQQQQQQQQHGGVTVAAATTEVLDGGSRRRSRSTASPRRREGDATDGADGQEADGDANAGDLATETLVAASRADSMHERHEQLVEFAELAGLGQVVASGPYQGGATDQPVPSGVVAEAEAEAEAGPARRAPAAESDVSGPDEGSGDAEPPEGITAAAPAASPARVTETPSSAESPSLDDGPVNPTGPLSHLASPIHSSDEAVAGDSLNEQPPATSASAAAAAKSPASQQAPDSVLASASTASPSRVPAAAAVAVAASTPACQVHFPTPIRNLTFVSPEHLLRAFPGLDPRAQALRTVGQALLQARHPQLGAAAADPGLLLLLLRRKGILSESMSDAAAAPLLTALLLSEPRFFRIVGAVGTGRTNAAATVAADAGGGGMDFAVQLRLDELMALVEPGRGGEPPAVAAAAAAAEDGSSQSLNDSQQPRQEGSAASGVDAAATDTDADEVVVMNDVLDADRHTKTLKAVFGSDTSRAVLDAFLGAVLDVVSCRTATETVETEMPESPVEDVATKSEVEVEEEELSGTAAEVEAQIRAPVAIVQEFISDLASAPKSDAGGSGRYSSGSGGRDAGPEGVDDEQSDDAHVAMLLRLLETGARLEEEPLPDSEAKLQRLRLSPLPLDDGDKAVASLPVSADVGAGSSQRVAHGAGLGTVSSTASGSGSSGDLDLINLEAVEEVLLHGESSRDARLEELELQPKPELPLPRTLQPLLQPELLEPLPPPPQMSPPLQPPQKSQQLLLYFDVADLDADADADGREAVTRAVPPVPTTMSETIQEPVAPQVPSSPSLSPPPPSGPQSFEVGAAASAAQDAEQLQGETSPGPSNASTPLITITSDDETSPQLSVERLAGALSDIVSSANDAVTAAAERRIASEQHGKLAVERHVVQSREEEKDLEAEAELTITSSSVAEAAATECDNTAELLLLGFPKAAEIAVVCSSSGGGGDGAGAAAAAATLPILDGNGEGVIGGGIYAPGPPFNESGPAAADGSIAASADENDDAAVAVAVADGAAGTTTTAATAAESCACGAGEAACHGSVTVLPAAAARESRPWKPSSPSPPPLLLPVSVAIASTAAAATADSAPSAAHLQPAVVRYISALDVEIGQVEVLAALTAMTQHCTAAGRVAIDCAVADLQPDVDVPEPTASSAEVLEEPETGALTGVDSDSYGLTAATTAVAAPSTTTAINSAQRTTDRGCSPVLLTVLAPAVAQTWRTTLYVLGVAGVGPENALIRTAVLLLTGATTVQAGPLRPTMAPSRTGTSAATPAADSTGTESFEGGRIVKTLWNARQVLSALSPLLPTGLRVGPIQDLQVLVRLATEDVCGVIATTTGVTTGRATTTSASTAGAAGPSLPPVAATESRAANLPSTAVASPSGASSLPHRPWYGMVPLQERLAELEVPGRDLASLAALRADAWGSHPLSCVVVAAAAKQLCQVLEVRRALLFGDEALLDTLMCGICSHVAATTE
ncbi:hypothetical protein Vretifemale_17773 [Volvox reticuliferus]|nr:hypothetical protein Vretifemale_17773 [Volvox reticuliferus]